MKTFSISTLGCKVNQYESQQIRELLQQYRFTQVDPGHGPDLAVINTCCVTSTASSKSRQLIRKIHRCQPQCAVIVCGCLPKTETHELTKLGINVYFVHDRGILANELARIIQKEIVQEDQSIDSELDQNTPIRTKSKNKIKPGPETITPNLPSLSIFTGQTRAFIKVQDGCDGHCAYCIIPKTRPIVASRPLHEIVSEATCLVRSGHKEIVVTGVFLGSYGQNTVIRRHWPHRKNPGLSELLDHLARIPDLRRIRLSSLEPADITDELIDIFLQHNNILPHLHLSLQSGSDNVLKRMCRQYRTQDFRQVVDQLKTHLKKPAITTDIIVGFPGETDADFDETVAMATEVGFSKMHVFGFSARQGTAAAKMPHQIPGPVIRERSERLRRLNADLGRAFRESFIGQQVDILVENIGKRPSGRCERYFKVYLEHDEQIKKNDLLRVRLEGHYHDGMCAHLLEKLTHD